MPLLPADQGYYHGAEIKACLDAGITSLVPRPLTSANAALGLYTKDDFVDDPGADSYRGPAGVALSYRTTTVELSRRIKNYRTRACAPCALCRGLAKVRGEFSLTTLAYNLKRVINLLSAPRLLAALA